MVKQSKDLTLEEVRELEQKATGMAFELEGKINLVQTDADGNVLLRDEMPGEACLMIIRDQFSVIVKEHLERLQADEALQSCEE